MGDVDLSQLTRAFRYAERVHGDSTHALSGQLYLHHLLDVASILATMRLDLVTLTAGLLHGIIKVGGRQAAVELEALFGKDVASIVSGTTRLTTVQFNSKLSYQAENIRKLLLAMSSDIRVLVVKLADRLHDGRCLDLYPIELREELAQEIKDLYAPLASRMGIDWMKRELEDLAFKHLHPVEYERLIRQVESSTADREAYVTEVIGILREKLVAAGVPECIIIGRPKHLASIYKKTVVQQIPVEKVYDQVAFRILVKSVKECYEVFGTVHANWPPVPGRIKDFISTPKSNGYQSLHTSVVGPQGRFMEVQIRTEEMDKIAQEGIAAHWAYKEGKRISSDDARSTNWLKHLIQWLQELKDPREFLESVKGGLDEQGDVYVLTPNGEVKEFVQGATPIDFAYAIHTAVGDHCVGAKVAGRIVPLKYQLQNGDQVEIITSPNQRPRRGWLSIAQSSRAKSRIRQYLRREEHEKAVENGREVCERELAKHAMTLKKIIKTGHFKELLKELKCTTLEDLLFKVGSGVLTIGALIRVLQPEEIREEKPVAFERKAVQAETGEVFEIEGVADMLVKVAQCCLPVPGDPIMGFITTGRGLSIHKADCPNFLATDPERRLEVQWARDVQAAHRAQIQIVSHNRKGLLAAIGSVISNHDANILEMDGRVTPDNMAVNNMVVEVQDRDHLHLMLQHLREIDAVVEAFRK